MNKIAVLIPCYNEAKTIEQVIHDFKTALPNADIYVYDNNSTDHTDEIALAAGAIVRYEHKQGKGNVIRSMFREIDADCYIMVDGDNTYPAESAPQMAQLVCEQGIDMVIGDRLSSTYFEENKRLFHNSGNMIVKKLVNKLFDGDVSDIMTGYRAFSKTFVKSFPVLSQGFEIETEMTIHALDKNLSMASIPVQYRDRPDGSVSKLNTYSDGVKVLRTIFKLYKGYKPFEFFSIVSLILAVVAILLFLPVLSEYFHTGLVLRLPTLIGSGFIMLTAILLFCCGLILDIENKKSRQNFEIQLNIIEMLNHTEKQSTCSAMNMGDKKQEPAECEFESTQ
ncbi:MAG: Glyco-trans-2-like domain-containing protein [Clostridium sp.]|jgi:glycosyltransferase involved in cell wall biosynthesis